MAFSIQMPALGESVTEGTVTRWLKQVGDRVEVDEPLLEVSTDKVDTEIPSPTAGVLQRIVADADETVEVGGELAVISDNDGDAAPAEQAPAEAPPASPSRASTPSSSDEPAPAPAAAPTATAGSGTTITMPELGESVTEGTVTRWLKQVGDSVAMDEPLLEVSTDKVDTEIPSPLVGTLLEIIAAENETVEIGGHLAVIGDAPVAPAAEPRRRPTPRPEPAPEQVWTDPTTGTGTGTGTGTTNGAVDTTEDATEAPDSGGEEQTGRDNVTVRSGTPYVTPLVRKLASEHGVDLTTITGSGIGGRVRKQDVLAVSEAAQQQAAAKETAETQAAAAPAGTSSAPAAPAPHTAVARPAGDGPQPGSTVKLPRLRQVIAQRMSESLRVSAQLTTVQEVDVTRVATLRARARAEFERREGVKLTYLPFFVKATVEALKAFPQLNASINDETGEVTYHDAVHLAIAVDTPRGLLVPVIRGTEDLNIAGLAKRIADVAARTREGRIGPDELSGGTFTITNIGSAGALFDTPIINQPQVAILGTGMITKQPVVVTGPDGEDAIAIRSVCYLPLTYDHRLVDGADAGRFVHAIKTRLEEGAFEADLGL